MLAVDASGSVSNDRFELQKQGYAAGFRNRQVLNSIRSLARQSIAVTMMQWTGPEPHVQTVVLIAIDATGYYLTNANIYFDDEGTRSPVNDACE
jgi:uncharacterized protein DUF1194